MKKKIIVVFVILFAFVSVVQASDGLKPLYRYVAAGTEDPAKYDLSYDTSKPLRTYYKYGSLPDDGEVLYAPETFEVRKTEFRGTWLATVGNLHLKQHTTKESFMADFTASLDILDEYNMNTLIFQVRPTLDAFYPSEINPYSEYFTGKQGDAPAWAGEWDALAWMVEETHKRGIEFHAWFNPYRVMYRKYDDRLLLNKIYDDSLVNTEAKRKPYVAAIDAMTNEEIIDLYVQNGILDENNYAVKHPQYLLRYDKKFILDPGYPEVRQHVVDSVMEVVNNYPIDAVHFDDYFYPYKVDGIPLFGNGTDNKPSATPEDLASFTQYGSAYGMENINAWRRDNVTAIVTGVNAAIKAYNETQDTAVQFGISPFGIWEHKQNNPAGSDTPTGSSSSYSTQIFADTKKWVEEELLDYIIPQVYWAFGTEAAPYGGLVKWWDNIMNGSDVNLYIGHAAYKYMLGWGWDPNFLNVDEMANQLKYNQMFSNVKGSSMYSINELKKLTEGSGANKDMNIKIATTNKMLDQIKELWGSYKPLPPVKKTVDAVVPTAVSKVTYKDGVLSWHDAADSDVSYYTIYTQDKSAFTGVQPMVDNYKNILKHVTDTNATNYTFDQFNATDYTSKWIVITATDNAGNESAPVIVNAETDKPTVEAVYTNAIEVKGTATPNYAVHVALADGSVVSTTASESGAYTVTIPLQKAGNVVSVTAVNPVTEVVSEAVHVTVAEVYTVQTLEDATKTVKVTAKLPFGANMKAEQITPATNILDPISKLIDVTKYKADVAYDISLLDIDGKNLSLLANEKATVRIPTTKNLTGKTVLVAHVHNGVTEVLTPVIHAGYVEVETTGLSPFIIYVKDEAVDPIPIDPKPVIPENKEVKPNQAPSTGDTTNVNLLFTVLLGAGIVVVTSLKRRNRT